MGSGGGKRRVLGDGTVKPKSYRKAIKSWRLALKRIKKQKKLLKAASCPLVIKYYGLVGLEAVARAVFVSKPVNPKFMRGGIVMKQSRGARIGPNA